MPALADPPPIAALDPAEYEWRGLRPVVLETALRAWTAAWRAGETERTRLAIVDFSTPSDERRLWVLDLATGQILFHTWVAHGSGSGKRMAARFSDREGSHQSSLGLARAAETYASETFHATALRLDGLEPGINGAMRDRAIVVHPAEYATEAAVATNRTAEGVPRLGRSQGCLALDPAVAPAVIEALAGGTLVYSYFPDREYLEASRWLRVEPGGLR